MALVSPSLPAKMRHLCAGLNESPLFQFVVAKIEWCHQLARDVHRDMQARRLDIDRLQEKQCHQLLRIDGASPGLWIRDICPQDLFANGCKQAGVFDISIRNQAVTGVLLLLELHRRSQASTSSARPPRQITHPNIMVAMMAPPTAS